MPSTSIPFPIKGIWFADLYARELWMLAVIVAVFAGWALYRAWKRWESLHDERPVSREAVADARLPDPDSPEFFRQLDSWTNAMVAARFGIGLEGHLTHEERARRVGDRDVARLLIAARDLEYRPGGSSQQERTRLLDLAVSLLR